MRVLHYHAEPDVDVVIPLEGVIDLGAERTRIEKDLDGARKELQGYERKLANEGYLSKAPPAVVEETRKRERDCRDRITGLKAALFLNVLNFIGSGDDWSHSHRA